MLLRDRPAGQALAAALLQVIDAGGATCSILDTEAFYASSLEVLAPGARRGFEAVRLYVPTPEFGFEELFPGPWGDRPAVVVVDNMNALLHKLSAEERPSANRKLAFLASLSAFLARSSRTAVIHTVYERSRLGERGGRSDLTDMTDGTILATLGENGLELRCVRGGAWPGGRFLFPSPSC